MLIISHIIIYNLKFQENIFFVYKMFLYGIMVPVDIMNKYSL